MVKARHEKAFSWVAAALCVWRLMDVPPLWREGEPVAAVAVALAVAVGLALALWDLFRPAVDVPSGDSASWMARTGWNYKLNGAAFCFFLAYAIAAFTHAPLGSRRVAVVGLVATAILAVAIAVERRRVPS